MTGSYKLIFNPLDGRFNFMLEDIDVNLLELQGDWDANTNTPDISGETTVGHTYYVTVAGNTNLGGKTNWEVGDMATKSITGWIHISGADIKAVWGKVTGLLSDQTDLSNALAGKAPTVHNHATQSINPDNIILNKSYTDAEAAALLIGTIFYNSDQADWLLKTSSDTYYNFGSELSPLMRNVDSVTHLNGQPVYVFGGATKFPDVKLANANAENTSYTIAIATQDVVNTGNKRGRYCAFGSVGSVPISNVIKTGENIALWVEGIPLYLATETGKLTTVRPIAPNHGVRVAFITDRSGANVNLFVHPDTGFELSELHDVDLAKTKVLPISADYFLLQDSENTNIWKKVSYENLGKNITLANKHNDVFGILRTALSGVTQWTDREFRSTGIVLPHIAKGDIFSYNIQFLHSKVLNTNLDSFHIHYSPISLPVAGNVIAIDYRWGWYNNGEVVPATLPNTGTIVFPALAAADQYKQLVSNILSNVAHPVNETYSSRLLIRCQRRNDAQDTYAGEFAIWDGDVHYVLNQLGSTNELTD